VEVLGWSGWIRSSTFFLGFCSSLQEDIQLLSDVVNCGYLGLGFFDKVVLLLLEFLSPFVESLAFGELKVQPVDYELVRVIEDLFSF